MAAYGMLALGIILVVLLILVARARIGAAGDDRDEARGLIAEEIAAHIEALAAGYLEARSGRSGSRPAADHFTQEIELFIADVLWRRAERSEPWLRDAMREVLVLERDAVWAQIRERVESYLREPPLAQQPRRARAKQRA
jgi:hypothetical protein